MKYMDFQAFDEKPLLHHAKKKPIYNMKSWRWALLDRSKYEDILAKFQKWVGKLRDLLPLSIASSLKHNDQTSTTLVALAKSENAKNLGLECHVQLWQLMLDPAFRQTQLELKPQSLEDSSHHAEPASLALAKLNQDTSDQNSFRRGIKVLIEYKSEDPDRSTSNTKSLDKSEDEKPIHQLASLLSLSGRYNLRTLPFKGYIHQPSQKRYAFVFAFPENVHRSVPLTLNSLIGTDDIKSQLSLPDRFRMAQTITKTLAAFHSANWVHKSMRSHSVVLFSRPENEHETMVKSPYLVNFEYSRQEKANTVLSHIEDLEKSLYCHPDRNPPVIPFSKIHDLYALGVVLLEIGLWCTALSIYKQYWSRMTETAKAQPLSARQIKAIMIDAAKHRLSHHMGPAYTSAVLRCLRDELDGYVDDGDFPIVFQSEVVAKLDLKVAM